MNCGNLNAHGIHLMLWQMRSQGSSDFLSAHQLLPALERLNPDLPNEAFQLAFEELTRDRSLMSPVQANREVYELLKDNVEAISNDRRWCGGSHRPALLLGGITLAV